MSDDELKKKMLEAWAILSERRNKLPVPITLEDGTVIDDWEALHASEAFHDPVRKALDDLFHAVKEAGRVVREFRESHPQDEVPLNKVVSFVTLAEVQAAAAVEEWKPHEYPRRVDPGEQGPE